MSHRTKLINRFYIGSAPGSCLGFDVVVLCAREYQPNAKMFDPALVIRIPLADTHRPFSEEGLRSLDDLATVLSRLWGEGRSVLVTCIMGRNRSALVSALTLSKITGQPTYKTAEFLKRTRKDVIGVPALQNEYFSSLLGRWVHST